MLVLRSGSRWSMGTLETESSIHKAYCESILQSKKYIYMECQFFISTRPGSIVQNKVADSLFQRILRAHEKGEELRVYVVLPLLPAFPGEITKGNVGKPIQTITHWNYLSISKGANSLLSRLRAAGIQDHSQYINFFSLRTFKRLQRSVVTELIYIHSKLMIVDDETVILGSANINDRSLLGTRDSELACVFQDVRNSSHRVHGKGNFASSLRKRLFREHLGLLKKKRRRHLSAPESESFYADTWLQTAASNTSIYDTVFPVIPTDKARNFRDLEELSEEIPLLVRDPDYALRLLEDIQGHLVLFPLRFLEEENLDPPVITPEGLLPTEVWI
ncbi:unnamed protein product [Darwinula stevensoni]|uniref:phospholipase D n=1 Tax=Darwinula stevensoni TaxID=69355 RepID=A0A7R9AGH5_9CRUS|nr:unnamed protein product [Darwinula stevensoni]CAG0903669.1 unnamed protein product [Darwinula stevensoni]